MLDVGACGVEGEALVGGEPVDEVGEVAGGFLFAAACLFAVGEEAVDGVHFQGGQRDLEELAGVDVDEGLVVAVFGVRVEAGADGSDFEYRTGVRVEAGGFHVEPEERGGGVRCDGVAADGDGVRVACVHGFPSLSGR